MPDADKQITIKDIERAPDTVPAPPAKLGSDREIELLSEVEQLSERLRINSEEKEELRDQLRELRRKFDTHDALNKLIEPYAKKAYRFMCCYSSAVGVVLLLNGFQAWGFHLDESVLDFLVGSTAVTVVGLVGMVLTGIFVGARSH